MNAVNLGAYLLALLLAGAGVLLVAPAGPAGGAAAVAASGAATVRDARGVILPVRQWQRIVTLDLVADELVANLVESGRIVAVSAYAQGPDAWRLAGKPRLPGLEDLEAVLRQHPDLILVSTFGGDTDRIQRLRDAGVAVFDLGLAGGLERLTANMRQIGTLVGAPERGERLAGDLTRRLAAVAARLPPGQPRRRALILTPVIDQVYGGSLGSSFHDILVSAGLIDAAAAAYPEPWPRLGAEQALGLDPDLVVTRAGGGADLRRIPGFGRLRALNTPGGLIELPVALYDSPGLSMLAAAEELNRLAYPESK